MTREIRRHVKAGSAVRTDEHKGYSGIGGRYKHGHVNPNDIHTNSIESVWAVLKRSIHGTCHSVSAKHLGRYAAEAMFLLNDGNVRVHTIGRMDSFVRRAFLRRIT